VDDIQVELLGQWHSLPIAAWEKALCRFWEQFD